MPFALLVLLAGLLLPLASAPFNLPVLAVVALCVLFAGWSGATDARQAFWRGYLFGLGQLGLGVSWVFVSMRQFGGATTLEAGVLTVLFVMFYSLYPALGGWLAHRLAPRHAGFRLIAACPAAWTLSELARGWLLTGFPWVLSGSSQTDTPLAGMAPVLGVYGVGWTLAVLSGLVLMAVRRRALTRPLMASILLLTGTASALRQVAWSRPAGEGFEVTLLQGNVPQEAKWTPENRLSSMRLYEEMTREHWGAALIVWPETAVPLYYHQAREAGLAGLETEAARRGADILLGVPYLAGETPKTYYNAIASLGQSPGFYFKRHRVPFGEYLPLRPVFGWVLDILSIPMADFSAGSPGQPPLRAAGYPLAASVCYEDIFGHEARAALPDAAYLVNVTNDAWFGDSLATHQHFQMARMRAIEAARYLVRAANTGVTGIVGPRGEVIASAPLFTRTTLTGVIRPMQGETPYVRWGDVPAGVGCILSLALAFWWRLRERCHQSPALLP